MSDSKSATLGARLKHELRAYAILAGYLYVCFLALVLYKAAILAGSGITYLPFGFAAAKALILGKFMLLGQAARLGESRTQHRLALVILYKAVLFAGLLICLSIVEEAVVALIHSEAIKVSLVSHLGEKLPETLAICLVLLLVLVPYIAFREIGKALGEDALGKLLFSRSKDAEA